MTLDEVIALAHAFKAAGITSVKLTGGDPALWEPLVDAVAALKTRVGMTPIEVISRHPSIGDRAAELAAAGTDVLNISLDTLHPDRHRAITGKADHAETLRAIDRCVAAGMAVKLNMVVMRGINEDEVMDLVRFAERTGVKVLKLLDVIRDLDEGAESFAGRIGDARRLADLYVPLQAISATLSTYAGDEGEWVSQGGLGHPMHLFRLKSGLRVLVKDHTAGAWYGSICDGCRFFPCHDALMAVRVTADLRLQYCLLREDAVLDLRPLLGDPETLGMALKSALKVYTGASFHEPAAEPRS